MFGSPASIVNTTSNKESIVATTSSSNYTGLYGANASPIVPTTAYGNANVVSLLAASTDGANTIGNISATGNITGVYLFGNGSQLTGLGATYSNATVSSYLASGLNSANIITTANVTGGNLTTTGLGGSITGANLITANTVSVSGNITATDFYGNGSGLTGITVAAGTQIINGTSNVSVALNGNTTIGVANVTQAQISSQGISAVGNITGSYFLGNGSQLTGLATVTAANSAVFLRDASNAAAYVNVDDSLKAMLLPGGGSLYYGGDGVDPNTYGSVELVNPQTNLANAYVGMTWGNAANLAANPLNTMVVAGFGAIFIYDALGQHGGVKNIQVGSGGVTTNTTLSAAGNITAPYFIGNGSALTGITATLPSTISVTGNITGGNIIATNDVIGVNLQTSGLITAIGNITGGNVSTAAQISAVGNITGGNLRTFGIVTATGNISGSNVSTPGLISATGNITGGNLSGTSIVGTLTTAAQTNITSVGTLGSLSVSGNITGGNLQATSVTGTTVSVSSTVVGGNLQTAGFASAVGNITGGNIITGGLITATASIAAGTTISAGGNITGSNISTGGLITATGNITGGNITGVSGSVATGIINYKDYVATITYASTITPNIALGSIQQVTLTGNVTMDAFGGTPQAGQSMVIKFIQDATGNRLLTSSMKWAGGAKTLSTAANAVDIASVFYDGSTYYASLTLAYA